MKKRIKPDVPPKLWMLWSDEHNTWIVDGDGYCCFTSLSEAQHVAARYLEEYDISCRPVRVKGGRDAR